MPSPSLTRNQTIKLSVIGAILWFVAAMMVRFGGSAGLLSGWWVPIVYVLTIPLSVAFVQCGRLAGISRDQTQISVAVMVASATLIDGIALSGFPALYGSDPAIILRGAALILWGVGVAMVLGMVMNRSAS